MVKKLYIVTVILLMLCAIPLKAQFSLTPDGFVNPKTPGKNYVVYEFYDMSQQEIFDAAVSYLYSIYVNPDSVLSMSGNSSITINGLGKNAIQIDRRSFYDIKYTISIQIREGRMRINAPYIVSMDNPNNAPYNYNEFYLIGLGYFKNGVFNKKGKVINETALFSIETFFEDYISRLRNGIFSGSNEEDW